MDWDAAWFQPSTVLFSFILFDTVFLLFIIQKSIIGDWGIKQSSNIACTSRTSWLIWAGPLEVLCIQVFSLVFLQRFFLVFFHFKKSSDFNNVLDFKMLRFIKIKYEKCSNLKNVQI